MLQKLRNNIFLALVFFILTLLQQYGFEWVLGKSLFLLPIAKYFALFILLMACSCIKNSKGRFIGLSAILFLNFFQMAHQSYFGTQIAPTEIYLLFTQANEISGTLRAEPWHLLIPFFFTIIPIGLGYFCQRKLKPVFEIKFIGLLLLLYVAYNPLRTFFTGNTWGRQPSSHELSGINTYLSTSYFLGRILPYKLSSHDSLAKNSSLKLELTKVQGSSWDKIIVIMGESLSYRHMELFGYNQPTTPFLSTLKDDPHFYSTVGLSSGVSTDISVAFFFNLGFGDAGGIKAAKGNQCLMTLAKEKNYSAHFISNQSAQQLRYIAPYICQPSLTSYQALENIAPNTTDINAAPDTNLLTPLEDLIKSKGKEFIVLHQRGSHGPWASRSSERSRIFHHADQRVTDYDNSIVEFDFFWKDMNQILKKSKDKILVLYLSDHGEAMGEKGRWGHGFLAPEAFEVPVLIQSFNQDLPEEVHHFPKYISQYQIGLFIAQQLGYKSNQKIDSHLEDFVIFGNDIDGLAGKARIIYHDDLYTVKLLP